MAQIPFNKEAEAGVLGNIIYDPNSFYTIQDQIEVSDFYFQANREIYSCLLELFERKINIDISTLTDLLIQKDILDKVGGHDYLITLANYTYSNEYLETYIKSVKDSSLRRQVLNTLRKLLDEGVNPNVDTVTYLSNIEQAVIDLSKKQNVGKFIKIDNVTNEVLDRVEKASKNSQDFIGLRTGFRYLDERTLGLQPGQLIILAARPSMGKSAMAVNLVTNIAKLNNANIALFSLEMPAHQLVERMIASVSMIDIKTIKIGNIKSNEMIRFVSACNRLNNLNIYFDDSTDLSINDLRAKCRKLSLEHKLDLVVIDYLQLLKSGSNHQSTNDEVKAISRALKILAMDLQIPVICLSQLSRSVEKRDDKKPLLSDLRDSGSIEQDADIVMFLYREDYYLKSKSTRPGEADLIISKNRSGMTDEGIPLLFKGNYSLFENLERPERRD